DDYKATSDGLLNLDILQKYAIADKDVDFESALQNGSGKLACGGIISVKSSKTEAEKYGKPKDKRDKKRIVFNVGPTDNFVFLGSDKTAVGELGRNLWRDNIIRFRNVNMKLKDTLLEMCIRKDVVKLLIRNIMKMLTDLGLSVCQQDFEKHFLDASTSFYRGQSQELIGCCDCGGYLKETEKRLNEETERVSKYLDVQSEMKITNVVKTEMIETHMTQLVHMNNSGLVNMILGDKYEDIGRIRYPMD
nr:cullin-3A isoform X2 [Tanacetum cinerariifolium]